MGHNPLCHGNEISDLIKMSRIKSFVFGYLIAWLTWFIAFVIFKYWF